MKKIVVFAALMLLFLNVNYGQTNIRFGFQLSPTFSWLGSSDNQITNSTVNLGLKLGVLGEYALTDRYSIVTGFGLAFNQGGGLKYNKSGLYWYNSHTSNELSNETVGFVDAGATLNTSVQYIEIPAALKLNTRYFGSIKYFAEIPSFNFGILTQARGSVSDTDISKENIKKDVKSLNVAWGLGAGAEYEISEGTTILAGLYFNRGITDVTKNDGKETDASNAIIESSSEDSKSTLGTITIRIGVMF